jgi:hypothetical protein
MGQGEQDLPPLQCRVGDEHPEVTKRVAGTSTLPFTTVTSISEPTPHQTGHTLLMSLLLWLLMCKEESPLEFIFGR